MCYDLKKKKKKKKKKLLSFNSAVLFGDTRGAKITKITPAPIMAIFIIHKM